MDHPLHPRQALHLVKNEDSSSSTISCHKCREKWGSMFYKCMDSSCGLRLDLLCSLPMIKILHRSHEHRLMVIRGLASFICGACGTQHQGRSAPSYLCSDCGFWIHRDCAALPNAIKLLHPEHQHSLFLTYRYSRLDAVAGFTSSSSKCAICGDVLQSLGVYLCVKCGYYVHITCATSDPHSFQPGFYTAVVVTIYAVDFATSVKHATLNWMFCCMLDLNGIFYECSNCRQLKLHAHCALLPTTLTHKFDRHPLKLTTSTKISVLTSTNDADADDSNAEHSEEEMQHFCDVCETDISKREWYYNCKQWHSSFHIDCIPFLNRGYRVKSGVSVDVNFHDCPLTLVPEATHSGYHCDVCRRKFEYMYSRGLRMHCAYECTKCNYRVHGVCARQSSEKKQ
ncbi:hypothetical protein C2S51_026224 [Perilla frutescens var. frutescens]|nr:hypothetical protein C2S51_026224 [Perilla frutescens var. frutescens]